MNKDEREKLLEEVLNKKRGDYNTVYNDSMKVIEATEKELNRMMAENKKGIDDLLKRDDYDEKYLASLKSFHCFSLRIYYLKHFLWPLFLIK